MPLDVRGDAFAGFRADHDCLVVCLDLGFDFLHAVVAVGALATLVAGTEEVLVCAAVAFVTGVDHAVAALLAEDRSLEIVRVLAITLAAQVVRLQDLLDAVE
ncbi:MAG TPA: hypothetical protein VNY27_07100 [Solirubrobacteraceae bacterium]|nr:hypothetical protein [Solirubrobacteraceae bacterium]